MGLFDENKKGLFDDDDDELDELFETLKARQPPYVCALEESTIQELFLRCLATKDTTEYLKSVLYQKEWGHEEDSAPILFDKKKVIENFKKIRYLYGQLFTTHKHSNTINTTPGNPHNSSINYKGEIWTDRNGVLMQFFHLGVVSDTIYPFTLKGNSGFKDIDIQPTLSPKDPDFSQWWEEHKVEWEGRTDLQT